MARAEPEGSLVYAISSIAFLTLETIDWALLSVSDRCSVLYLLMSSPSTRSGSMSASWRIISFLGLSSASLIPSGSPFSESMSSGVQRTPAGPMLRYQPPPDRRVQGHSDEAKPEAFRLASVDVALQLIAIAEGWPQSSSNVLIRT